MEKRKQKEERKGLWYEINLGNSSDIYHEFLTVTSQPEKCGVPILSWSSKYFTALFSDSRTVPVSLWFFVSFARPSSCSVKRESAKHLGCRGLKVHVTALPVLSIPTLWDEMSVSRIRRWTSYTPFMDYFSWHHRQVSCRYHHHWTPTYR